MNGKQFYSISVNKRVLKRIIRVNKIREVNNTPVPRGRCVVACWYLLRGSAAWSCDVLVPVVWVHGGVLGRVPVLVIGFSASSY